MRVLLAEFSKRFFRKSDSFWLQANGVHESKTMRSTLVYDDQIEMRSLKIKFVSVRSTVLQSSVG